MVSGLFVIMITLIAGGLLAYLGSIFGRQIGRRKISFWGLRPRYTSLLVVIIIGMFISLFTVVLIAIVSQKAKIALLGLSELQNEKRKLEEEIQKLSETQRKSSALFQLNEPVSSGVVRPGTYQDTERQLMKILSDASMEVAKRYDEQAIFLKRGLSEKGKEKNLIEYDTKEFANIVENLASIENSVVVLVYSEKNVFFGEKVRVKCNVYPNILIARKGEKLFSMQIKGDGREEKIFFSFLNFLRELEQNIEKRGMIRVPRGKILIDISISDIFSAMQEIKRYNDWVEVTAYAVDDLFTIGPVTVKLKINPL